jgi:hypothetical protein
MELTEVRKEIAELMTQSAAVPGEDWDTTCHRIAELHGRLLQQKVALTVADRSRDATLTAYKRVIGRYLTAAKGYCTANAAFTGFMNQYGEAVREIQGPKSFWQKLSVEFFGEDPETRRIDGGLMSEYRRRSAKLEGQQTRVTEIERELDLLTERLTANAMATRARRSRRSANARSEK